MHSFDLSLIQTVQNAKILVGQGNIATEVVATYVQVVYNEIWSNHLIKFRNCYVAVEWQHEQNIVKYCLQTDFLELTDFHVAN